MGTLANMWEGLKDLPTAAKIVLGVSAGGAGYLVYQHGKKTSSTTSATDSSGMSSAPISGDSTQGISSGGPGGSGFWPFGNGGPVGPPQPAPTPQFATGSVFSGGFGLPAPGGPIGPAQPPPGGFLGQITTNVVPLGGTGLQQGRLPTINPWLQHNRPPIKH